MASQSTGKNAHIRTVEQSKEGELGAKSFDKNHSRVWVELEIEVGRIGIRGEIEGIGSDDQQDEGIRFSLESVER